MRESELLAAVLVSLKKLPGITAWRCNAGRRGGVRLAPRGVPDIIGYLSPRGRFFGVELKADHKDACPCKSCSAQRVWASRAIANGVLYVKARTVEEAVNGLTVEAVL